MREILIYPVYDAQHPEEFDNQMYAASQELLSQLDEQQLKTLQELKTRVDVGAAPCIEQYKPMYSEGYATGHAYFTLTKQLLKYYGGIETASAQNAYIAGWHEGQHRALQEYAQQKYAQEKEGGNHVRLYVW